jgi:CheY-like chemotaxis protein
MTNPEANSKPAILVVEDEALLRFHAADLLAENGYVVEAPNAELR